MKGNTIFYCEKRDDEFFHFYNAKFLVQMCGANEDEIALVRLEESENGKYYAMKDLTGSEEDLYNYIYPIKESVLICAPDLFKGQIERGESQLVRLDAIELDKENQVLEEYVHE